ncbi:T9SS type A sorting domain-containing protein [Pontibacter vulgaris]|uniref:T9SS type A sorting domain-containing protein n=1 Tax=Pontibacter vulgaris TaxID=2905679 RepID=UPI001FA6D6D1|nr:T9SS type A sorting domain-containing protein [Pontibacter vulgaris]
MNLISNSDGPIAIDALSASYPENPASPPYTASYIITPPPSTQGVLYVDTTPITATRTITPAEAKLLKFDPASTFYGVASFTFKAIDNSGNTSSNDATYSLPVNAAPVAFNVSSGNLTKNVRSIIPLLNATDPDGNIVSYTIVSLPTPSPDQGELYLGPSGGSPLTVNQVINTNQLYYEAPNANGLTRTFTYRATDNKGVISSTATYYLYVGTTTPPTAANVTIATMPNTSGSTTISPLSAIGGTITNYGILASSVPTSAIGLLYTGSTLVTTLTLAGGYYTLTPAQAANLNFDPASTYSGTVTFTYTATSSNGTSPNATYTIPVTYPPVAKDLTSLIDPNLSTAQSIAALSATDQDGSISNFIITSLPALTQGKLTLYGADVTGNQVLTPLQAKDLKFVKGSNFTSPVTFKYNATDNMGVKAGSDATYNIKSSVPLPVELAYFTGTYNGSTVMLKWLTASEKNNEKFIIERSSNGKTFEVIGQVAGQGDSFQATRYSFTDQQPGGHHLYYRLKQVDFDGTSTYSKIIALTGTTATQSQLILTAYPNPTKGLCTALVTNQAAGNSHIQLLDLQGRLVLQKELYLEKGLAEIPLDLSNTATGLYLLQVQTGNHTRQTKVLISR